VSKRLPRFSPARIVFCVTALIVVYFLATFAVNFVRDRQLGEQESGVQAEIDELRERNERLTDLEEYLNSDEYIETIAREELGLVKEGEIGFVAISSQPAPTPAPGEPRLWWEVLIR
jgi:cell division protein DivIC